MGICLPAKARRKVTVGELRRLGLKGDKYRITLSDYDGPNQISGRINDVVRIIKTARKTGDKQLMLQGLDILRTMKARVKKQKQRISFDKADSFFERRYKTTYVQLLRDISFRTMEDISKYLTEHAGESRLVLFPTLGSIFNYYVARGILNEIRIQRAKKGLHTNLRLATIDNAGNEVGAGKITDTEVIARGLNPLDNSTLNTEFYNWRINYAKEQIKHMVDVAEQETGIKPRSITIVDTFGGSGTTYNIIVNGAEKLGLSLHRFVGATERQNLSFDGQNISGNDLFLKTTTGKVYPLYQLHNMKTDTIDKMRQYRAPRFDINLDYIRRHNAIDKRKISRIKEMLFYFGRIFYLLGVPRNY